MSDKLTGLALLRQPFPPHQISKLPKPTKTQTDAVRADFKAGTRCKVCGTWHHPDVVHLDYVGHAALTDRLLDADPAWAWEPLAMTADGLPVMDPFGGMWIKLTVCGVTRLGYGDSQGKEGGNAIKEVIGDALRNAAMRFGAALDLWHKGDLHLDDEGEKKPEVKPAADQPAVPPMPPAAIADWINSFDSCATVEELAAQRTAGLASAKKAQDALAYSAIDAAARKRKAALEKQGVAA